MRRPLIEEHRQSWGLANTVKTQAELIRELQIATREGDIVVNRYTSGGVGGSSGGGSGVTDHGALTGLADDDHPHYATHVEAVMFAWALGG